jgi:esterase/lipase
MELSATGSTTPLPVHTACAYVLHGLNSNPSKMKDITSLISEHAHPVSQGILTGHHAEDQHEKKISALVWKTETLEQWLTATASCTKNKSERIFVGYSLGALSALSLFDGNATSVLPTKMILIAPALMLRKKTTLIQLISWLPFGRLPSLNHPDYRAQSSTPLTAYKALFELNAEWKENSFRESGKIPTLLVLAPEDELVDSQAIAERIGQQPDTRWKILWLDNSDSTLRPRYNHLMIDAASQGSTSWKKFTEAVRAFLTDESKE